MPPKGKTKAQYLRGKLIGNFSSCSNTICEMEKKLIAQEKLIAERQSDLNRSNNLLKSLDTEIATQQELVIQKYKTIECLNVQSHELNKSIDVKNHAIDRRRKKLQLLDRNISGCHTTSSKNNEKNSMIITKRVSIKRKLKPTNEHLNEKAKFSRRNETFQACSLIHGGTDANKNPIVHGMLDTLTAKCKTKELSQQLLQSKESLVGEIKRSVLKSWSTSYYKSEDNGLRSLNVYYSHNVMGKIKYIKVRKANKYKMCKRVTMANYLPYKDLAELIRTVDIGNVQDVKPTLTFGCDDGLDGCYRAPAELALRLAKFYLQVNGEREDKLHTFSTFAKKDARSSVFIMAIGGDGAPGSGTLFLLSFLNIGLRIASSSECFLLLGANVEENSKLSRNFILKLLADIKFLESKAFEVHVESQAFLVEFKLNELPNDMKTLAFLAGELSNAAYYFSTFGTVNQGDANDHYHTYGSEESDYWKPLAYSKRLLDAKKVQLKKSELAKTNANPTTQRSNLTSYISKTLKSRQEEVPIIGQYIECAKCEPLYLKNNVVKEMFVKLLKIAVSQSKLGISKAFSQISSDVLFVKFVSFIQYDMNCNYLASKIRKWFNENCGKVDRDFTFRFRGKESFSFLKNFPFLIVMIIKNVENVNVILRLHQIQYEFILLRNVVSYSVRIESFDENIISAMREDGKSLFKACCIFDQRVSPSLWALCLVAPVHAKETYRAYHFGLGCNTMEGR